MYIFMLELNIASYIHIYLLLFYIYFQYISNFLIRMSLFYFGVCGFLNPFAENGKRIYYVYRATARSSLMLCPSKNK